MMQDFNCVWPLLASIVGPPKHTRQHVLGSLEPFETDNRCCRGFGLTALDRSIRKSVDIFPRNRRFLCLHAALDGDPIPWIWHLAVKFAWMQSMDNTPCAPAKRHGLLGLARSLAKD